MVLDCLIYAKFARQQTTYLYQDECTYLHVADEGGRKAGREEGREGRREGGMEGWREGWREGGREGGRAGGREPSIHGERERGGEREGHLRGTRCVRSAFPPRVHARPFVGVFQSPFTTDLSILDNNFPQNGSKNEEMAPRTRTGYPHQGPFVVRLQCCFISRRLRLLTRASCRSELFD